MNEASERTLGASAMEVFVDDHSRVERMLTAPRKHPRVLRIALVLVIMGVTFSSRKETEAGGVRYIGTLGVDRSDCTGGTRANPWKTWTNPQRNGCIGPGDTVYFLEGTYRAGDGIFDGTGSNRISFYGEAGNPITIAPDPQAVGDWPVKFMGFFVVDHAWGVVAGIEFDGNGGSPLHLNGSHLVLRGNYIHGRQSDVDFSKDQGDTYDCVKIYAGSPQNVDLQLVDNEIAYCPEDCIDVTGAKDLVYRGNDIYGCSVIQIKGGTENILVEQNQVHNMKNTFRGAGMACSQYCGSPTIPLLPVSERFVAKNVIIRNNLIYHVVGWDTIGANGWEDAQIYHNTFYALEKNMLVVGASGFDFTDDIAREYCASHTCGTCRWIPDNCWNIQFLSKNVEFKNNVAVNVKGMAIYAYRSSLSGFSAGADIYHSPTFPASFKLTGSGVPDQIYHLADFPYESGSFEQLPGLTSPDTGDFRLTRDALARDRGIDVRVPTDFAGNPRDSQPDIGAYEFVPTFADVPFEHAFHDEIEILYQNGYTAGCAVDPLRYCPDATMNRAESAVFVEHGIHGADLLPPQPTYQTFADLPLDSWAAKWAEALWQDHFTAGCGANPLIYCPWQGHTRAEGCVFYLHMLNGPTYEPPQPSQQGFADVPLDTWYAKWVRAAYDAGLITACQETPDLRFCPNDPLSRALAAYMMVQAKGLELP